MKTEFKNQTLNEIINFSLIEIEGYTLKVSTIIILTLFILFSAVLLKVLKKIIYKSSKFDSGKKFSIYNLCKYFIIFFCIIISLQIIGFDLSVLMAGCSVISWYWFWTAKCI